MRFLLILAALLLASSCRTPPGCSSTFCDYKDELTVYGRNVHLLYEDNFREISSNCAFRTELTTGDYVPMTQQQALTILRNMAGEMGGNALVFQSFRKSKDASGRVYVCSNFGSATSGQVQSNQIPTQTTTQTQSQVSSVVIQPDTRVTSSINTRQNTTPTNTQQQNVNLNQVQPIQPVSQAMTVNDTGRKLSWQTCSMGQSYSGGKCSGQAVAETFQSASSYCSSQSTAGYTYRLPDRIELASLLTSTGTPKADPRVFPDTKPDIYWTRESYNNSPITNWVVDFGAGGSFGYGTENQAYVRCVANLP